MAVKTAAPVSAELARWLAIARGLLERPTAPCKEDQPKDFVRAFAEARPELALTEDAAGNLLLKYDSHSASPYPLVLMAHLDHPGFWITKATREKARLVFKGGVAQGHTHPGCRVCFFTPRAAEPTGRGELAKVTVVRKRLARAVARITDGVALPGGFAMWDFPAFSVENGLITARACDDILGAALALCVLDETAHRRPRGAAVWALLTRAEEIGFLGALEGLRLKTIPKRARVLSLECSKAAGSAAQGEGVVVRVGDKSSIFDPRLSEALRVAAEDLRRKQRGFKYQRKLMDGGACEATPFCAWGYRASGVALPLGNYHNQAATSRGPDIGPETVNVNDFACGVRLLTALAMQPRLPAETPGKIPAWLKERAAVAKRELGKKLQREDLGF